MIKTHRILGDNMEIVFSSLEELYNRLKPVLLSKEREFKRNGFSYLKENDVWNYLKEIKWKKTKDLELYQMVASIIDVTSDEIDKYLKQKLETDDRKLYFNEDTSIL